MILSLGYAIPEKVPVLGQNIIEINYAVEVTKTGTPRKLQLFSKAVT